MDVYVHQHAHAGAAVAGGADAVAGRYFVPTALPSADADQADHPLIDHDPEQAVFRFARVEDAAHVGVRRTTVGNLKMAPIHFVRRRKFDDLRFGKNGGKEIRVFADESIEVRRHRGIATCVQQQKTAAPDVFRDIFARDRIRHHPDTLREKKRIFAQVAEGNAVGRIPGGIDVQRSFVPEKMHQYRIAAGVAVPMFAGSFQPCPADAIAPQLVHRRAQPGHARKKDGAAQQAFQKLSARNSFHITRPGSLRRCKRSPASACTRRRFPRAHGWDVRSHGPIRIAIRTR